jgi:WhiB family transcriptional regulator, redox-sensing transcriptional regulator
MKDDGWKLQGLCREVDPDTFFPDVGESTRPAKFVCRRCKVQTECLEYALENEEAFGVWGGMSARERRKYLKRVS